jgi:hypothetical protein
MTRRAARSGVAAWIAALGFVWLALAALGYRARDPDSRLYAEIAARMAQAPPAGWIAPDFPPGWFMSGPFREHPVGLFVPAALLARLGYPAGQAGYAMNAVYQAATLVLLPVLAAALVDGVQARALAWLLQLLPIAFTFRVRANQEQALLLCLVVALLGTERSRRAARWAVLTAAGLVGLMLVKGAFALFGPALCALWLVARRRDGARESASERGAWLGLAAAVVALVAAAALYEGLYRAATNEPFWPLYLSRQLGQAASVGTARSFPARAASSVSFYLARILWFAFPWSLALLLAAARTLLSRSRGLARTRGGAAAGAAFVAAMLLFYVGAFSLFDRRADRYVFPVYFAVGAAGAVVTLARSPRFARFAGRLDRPWVPAAVFTLAFVAHLLAGPLGVPTVKVVPRPA